MDKQKQIEEMRFKVIDNNTGKEADICEIALKEDWAKDLIYCDMQGFAILDDGNLVLLDECGKYVYCPNGRFSVIPENAVVLTREEQQKYAAYKIIEPQIRGCLDRERELEKRNSALLIEKDAMEANCIALQKKFDGVKTIGDWVYEVHKNAVQHGWYDGNGAKNFGELLMLVVTEVAEVMEEYRNGRLMKETYVNKNGKMCGIPSELADIVIRVMDICGYYNIDLEQAIAEKHEYNKSRPYKHGGKKC